MDGASNQACLILIMDGLILQFEPRVHFLLEVAFSFLSEEGYLLGV